MSRAIFIDIETNGLDPERHSVVEVAVVVVGAGDRIVQEFSSLADPGPTALMATEPEALRVNGLTIEEIQAAPPAVEVARKLKECLDGYKDYPIHAYHRNFDEDFLRRPPWEVKGLWGECVMEAAAKVMEYAGALRSRRHGKPKYPTLTEAAHYFGVAVEGLHRGLLDAKLLHRVYSALLRVRENVEDY